MHRTSSEIVNKQSFVLGSRKKRQDAQHSKSTYRIQTDTSLSTQGSITNKPRPTLQKPWIDFPIRQQQLFERAYEYIQGAQCFSSIQCLKSLAKDLEAYQRLAIEQLTTNIKLNTEVSRFLRVEFVQPFNRAIVPPLEPPNPGFVTNPLQNQTPTQNCNLDLTITICYISNKYIVIY